MSKESRFVEDGTGLIIKRKSGEVEVIKPKSKSEQPKWLHDLLTKGRFIQDPETGLMQGSEPGPNVEGGGEVTAVPSVARPPDTFTPHSPPTKFEQQIVDRINRGQRVERDIKRGNDPVSNFNNELPLYNQWLSENTQWPFMQTPKGIAVVDLHDLYRPDDQPQAVELNWLVARDRGAGRAAMELMAASADRHGVTIEGWARSKPTSGGEGKTLSRTRLEKFYKGFGFRVEKRDRDGFAHIVREPKTQSRPKWLHDLLFKGRHIQDPETGLMQGSEPGPSVEGGGGSGSTSGGKRGKINEASFAKDGVEFHSTNPEKAMQRWNQRIKMSPGEFRDKFLGGEGVGDMKVTYYANRDTFNLRGDLFDGDKTIGSYEHEVNFQDNAGYVSHLVYNDANQGKGNAREQIAANIAAYQELGLKQVDLEAALEVGGYAWAKYGWAPNKATWTNPSALRLHLEAAHRRLPSGPEKQAIGKLVKSSDPRAIWQIADNKAHGKDMLLGSRWLGSLNFSDKKAMRRFDGYIAKKK